MIVFCCAYRRTGYCRRDIVGGGTPSGLLNAETMTIGEAAGPAGGTAALPQHSELEQVECLTRIGPLP